MNFTRVAPNTHYRGLRLMSQGGRWEIGLNPYRQGVRLRMGQTGFPPQVMDFCLGRDPELFPKVLIAVLRRLDPLAETCTASEVDATFPWAGTRPDLAVHLTELINIRGDESSRIKDLHFNKLH
jgi:hypothetical protein